MFFIVNSSGHDRVMIIWYCDSPTASCIVSVHRCHFSDEVYCSTVKGPASVPYLHRVFDYIWRIRTDPFPSFFPFNWRRTDCFSLCFTVAVSQCFGSRNRRQKTFLFLKSAATKHDSCHFSSILQWWIKCNSSKGVMEQEGGFDRLHTTSQFTVRCCRVEICSYRMY